MLHFNQVSQDSLRPAFLERGCNEAVAESWDEAKRCLIESRMRDLEISSDIERVCYFFSQH